MKFSVFVLFCVLFGSNAYCQSRSAAPPASEKCYKWCGSINHKIPVFIWFTVDNQNKVLYGQVTYTNLKKPKPINLAGTSGKKYSFYEFDKDGNSTGTWEGKVAAGQFTGKWYSPKSEKSYPFALQLKDTVLENIDTSLAIPENITGEYSYFCPDGGYGVLDAKKIDSKHIKIMFSTVSQTPAHDLGQIDPVKISLNKNRATYSIKDESGQCKFYIDFYKHFAIIKYACDDCTDCGFGVSATVDGLYIKTADKPDFKISGN